MADANDTIEAQFAILILNVSIDRARIARETQPDWSYNQATFQSTTRRMFLSIAIIAYLIAAWLIWSRLRSSGNKRFTSDTALFRLALVIAIAAHAVLIVGKITTQGGINLALGNAFSLLALTVTTLYLLTSFFRPTFTLGIVILPTNLLALLVGTLIPGSTYLLADLPAGLVGHLLIAVLAYGFLSLAVAQALLLILQDKQLRQSRPDQLLLPAMPAIQTMEANLFQLASIGFILLSINLVTGIITTLDKAGTSFIFNHHTLLSITAWLGFGILLTGRYLRGWRGEIAARWIIAGFVVLGLAYFGTRFVVSVILN